MVSCAESLQRHRGRFATTNTQSGNAAILAFAVEGMGEGGDQSAAR
jgi:hypothetical protein